MVHTGTPELVDAMDKGEVSIDAASVIVLVMPFGKYRGKRLVDVAVDLDYVDWLLSQSWFQRKHRVLYERFQSDRLFLKIRAVGKEKLAAVEENARRLRAVREAEQQAREARWEQEWLDRHIVKYDPRGILPLAKYKGQPLAVVASDDAYCAWFRGSAYARINQDLAPDLNAIVEATAAARTATQSVEFRDGGCTVFRPANRPHDRLSQSARDTRPRDPIEDARERWTGEIKRALADRLRLSGHRRVTAASKTSCCSAPTL